MPLIEREWLTRATTDGPDCAVRRAARAMSGARCCRGGATQATQALDAWLALFGDRYYIEVQRIGAPGEDLYLPRHWRWRRSAACRRWPPTTCASWRAADFEAHEARVCIHDGTLLADPSRPRRYTPQQFLRSPSEMQALFRRCTGGARQQRGDRAPLQPDVAARRGAAAGVSGAAATDAGRVPAGRRRARAGLALAAATTRGADADRYRAAAGDRNSRSSARWASPATS